MQSWLILATVAQLIAAFVALVDKRIVSDDKVLPRAFGYAFVTCLMSGASILVYALSGVPTPFPGVHFPSIANITAPTLTIVAFSFLAAYTFFGALVSMFSALRESDASDVVPVIGSVTALATFLLGYLFLDTHLTRNFFAGIALLVVGTVLVSHFRFTWKTAALSVHAGIFFALHYVTFKGLLAITTFDNAFFWSRIGFVFYALSLLLIPEYLEKIRVQGKRAGKRVGVLVIGNKVLAGISSILVLKATELGNPAVIQALGGLQFVFILVLGLLFGRSTPIAYGENSHHLRDVLHKAVFVSMIALGFFMLFV